MIYCIFIMIYCISTSNGSIGGWHAASGYSIFVAWVLDFGGNFLGPRQISSAGNRASSSHRLRAESDPASRGKAKWRQCAGHANGERAGKRQSMAAFLRRRHVQFDDRDDGAGNSKNNRKHAWSHFVREARHVGDHLRTGGRE